MILKTMGVGSACKLDDRDSGTKVSAEGVVARPLAYSTGIGILADLTHALIKALNIKAIALLLS